MEIRYAFPTEKEEIRALWNYCFADTEKENEFYFSSVYDEKNTIVASKDHTILAALQMNPHTLQIGSHIHHVCYIVGVSVLPEYRGKGISNQLMRYCLDERTKKGEEIVLLMPIDTAIYRRYGFINIFFQSYAHLDLKDLHPLPPTAYRVQKAQHTPQHTKILVDLYERAMTDQYGFIQRDQKQWKRKLAEVESSLGQTYLIFDETGAAAGSFTFYLSYNPAGESFVDELIFLKKEALWEVLRFCKGHQTQTRKIKIQAVDKEFLALALGYDNKIPITQKPFMMARSLCPSRILQNMFFQKELPDFTLLLKGDSIQKADRLFFISSQGLKVEEKTSSSFAQEGLDENAIAPFAPYHITATQEGLLLWYFRSANLKTLEAAEEIFVSEALRPYFAEASHKLGSYANEYL